MSRIRLFFWGGISTVAVSSSAFSTPPSNRKCVVRSYSSCAQVNRITLLHESNVPSSHTSHDSSSTPLCDLQTFLKLCSMVDTGGEAKKAIQGGDCGLNGEIETRRAKKLFPGDTVSYGGKTIDVAQEVSKRGYVYKVKAKKVKPVAEVLPDGTLEFGGRFRSEEWRAERKQKKEDRKKQNSKKD